MKKYASKINLHILINSEILIFQDLRLLGNSDDLWKDPLNFIFLKNKNFCEISLYKF